MPDNNLRPDLLINQVFRTTTPVVLPSPLPVVYSGVNRQMVWRATAGTFVGGPASDPYTFPGLISGATVERETATTTLLRPEVFIQNVYGTAEVSANYNWSASPPSFTLAASLDATFEVSSGITGEYSASSGKFIDSNADFIEDLVAAGDVIKVDGAPSFDITLIVSDDELDVTKIDKGNQTYSGDLSAEDAYGVRLLDDASFDTSDVAVGDLVTVSGWETLFKADGINYAAEVTGQRDLESELQTFQTDGVLVFTEGTATTPSTGGQVWLNNAVDWIPTFQVDTVTDEQNLVGANLLAAWPTTAATGTDEPFEIFNYTGLELDGLGNYQEATGEYTTAGDPPAGTFTTTDVNIDFTALITAGPGVITDYFIVIHDSDTVRPIFWIDIVDSAQSLSVHNVDRTNPAAGGPISSLTWELWYDGAGGAAANYFGAAIAAEIAGVRLLTIDASQGDFTTVTPTITAGDVIYDENGVALFEVVTLDTATQLTVQNLVAGSPASGYTDTSFGFYLTDFSNSAQLLVTGVMDTDTLRVRNVLSDPPGVTAYTDLYYAVEVADALSNLNYTIEKTVSGTNLTGTVLSTFTARRDDLGPDPVAITPETLTTTLGFAVPDNPLALACSIGVENSPYDVYAVQVADDTIAGWDTAIEAGNNDTYYSLCPMTQNETVLAAFRTHVDVQSEPEQKRERILFQNHLFERITTRTTDEAGDNGTFTKTSTTTTITVDRDLEPYGVIVGDRFVGLTPAFDARIITLVTGGTSTMTVVNDNGLTIGGPTDITDWEIKSKDLLDAEYAAEIALYPATIRDRRIRNIFPSSVQVAFTDETDATEVSGFYGGGDVISTVGGEFLAALSAGMRAATAPGQPLSQVPGTGVYQLLNPFGDPYGGNQTLNDVVINGGHWVMFQAILGGEAAAVRAISTDTTEIFKMEDSVTVQVDNFARKLRQQIRPLLGRYNISGPFFDMVSGNQEAVRVDVMDAGDARDIKFLGINEVEDQPDTFAMSYDFTPLVSAAKGEITIFI